MCVCATCVQVCEEAKMGISSHGARVTGSCDPPSLGVENKAGILCKSNICSASLNSLQPRFFFSAP